MPSKTVISSKMNPDIAKERKAASFNVEEFARWFHGGSQKLNETREIVQELFSDPEFVQDVRPDYLSYRDQYDATIKSSTRLMRKLKELQEKRNPGGSDIYPNLIFSQIGYGITPQGTPMFAHFLMFVPAIENHGTPQQVAKWLPLAKNCEIIGCYSQTELSHGTFVRGIQTRADYDPTTEEFVLNSPSKTAYKWWIGGLGNSVNYNIVVAQLYINNKHRGIQLFIVQVRDMQTHMPLPGIDIGDIGNKLGYNGMNNGYLGLKNVRIPRMHMLMRYAQVDADGTFTSSPMVVLAYWTLVSVRVMVSRQSGLFLSLASTIATRFSAVRRQSRINPKEPEHQIMDHVTQQLKIFPEIGKAIVIRLGSEYLFEMYHQVTKEIDEGKFDRLAEIHALSACLKSITTTDSSAGVEILRLACGGHGYTMSSNLPVIYSLATAAATYEGENTILLLQTARFLMKSWSMVRKGEKVPPTVEYLEEAVQGCKSFPEWDGSLEWMVKALEYTAANKVRVAYDHMSKRRDSGMTPEEAANATSIELAQAADLHGRSFLVNIAWQRIAKETYSFSSSLRSVLFDILELYLVNACLRNLSDILRFIGLTEETVTELQTKLEQVLSRIRPNAVAIVDGFDHHDRTLNSDLGCYDGNVYERIFEEAVKSPMNKAPVQKSFHLHLKPFMNSNL